MTEPKAKPEAESEPTPKAEIKAAPKPGPAPDAKDDLKTLPMAEVEKKLGSSPDGLTQAEAQKRLTQYGPNEIEEKKTNPLLEVPLLFLGPNSVDDRSRRCSVGVARHWPDFFIILVLFWPTLWSDFGRNARRATPSPH